MITGHEEGNGGQPVTLRLVEELSELGRVHTITADGVVAAFSSASSAGPLTPASVARSCQVPIG